MKPDNNVRYVGFLASAAALWWLAEAGILPLPNPLHPEQYIIDTSAHSPRLLRKFFQRPDVIVSLTWLFATSGATITLPGDFNITSNQFNAIGSGVGGSGGGNTGTGACCNAIPGGGGNGGAAGAFAQISNYSAHGAGAVVNCQVGAGDTWFDSTSVLLAKAGSGITGGQASACVGTVKFSGGNAGTGGPLGVLGAGGGGGGGGAGGPHGNGNNGANGVAGQNCNVGGSLGGAGATGDAGHTAAGASGVQFGPNASSQFTGPGGGGAGGNGGNGQFGAVGGTAGVPGSAAGFYGAGGGGGGGASANNPPLNGGAGGSGTQGLIAFSYTPTTGASRSYGFVIG